VISWFQSLLSNSTCTAYTSDKAAAAAAEKLAPARAASRAIGARVGLATGKAAGVAAVVGLYKSNAAVTHSLKGAWFFNP
jgi:hypothetical protein